MAAFLYGHAKGADWRKASREATKQLGRVPEDANLGFVYVTQEVGDHLSDVVRNLKIETGVEQWIGAAGIGICATGAEYFHEPAVAVMVGAFPPDSFRLFDTERDGQNDWTAPGAQGALSTALAIVHGDPAGPEVLRMLPFFAEASGAFLAGGLASPEARETQVAGEITGGGLSGAVFGPAVPVATAVSQGCVPAGPLRHITECVRNVAVRIDDRPALDVLYEDAGADYRGNLRAAAGRIFVAFPVEGSDQNDFLVRNIVGADEERGLLGIGAPLEAGQAILFTLRDADAARQDLRERMAALRKRLRGRPRGAVYCSCVARGPHLFAPQEEMTILREELGDVPLVGFFGSGEISNNRLYTQTGVLTVFLED